jgi:chemotaxis protein MotB
MTTEPSMGGRVVPAAAAISLAAVILSACVSQSAYNEQAAQLQKVQAEAAAQQAQIAKMQAENKWVMAGDLLFPEGGYQLEPNGQAALGQYVPQLKALQNTKIVVYGYTDNLPVGPALQRAGVANNVDLSSRRAANVVAYFRSQGVNPNILSAKGFGETHPIAPNDSPPGRAQNRRIEIVLEGPGA